MEKIAFIGSFDKLDLILYVAKALTNLGNRVLVVDTTLLQKSRYVVPTMKVLKKYVTTCENIDIAIGFDNINEVRMYNKREGREYDYALFDIDTYRGYYYSAIKTEDKKFFVTSFDVYSLRRGLQVFNKLTVPTSVIKVLFTKDMLSEEDEYLNYISKDLKVKWEDTIVYFPFEVGDQSAIFTNQRTGKIMLRGLTQAYIDSISYITELISGENSGKVKKAIKMIDRN